MNEIDYIHDVLLIFLSMGLYWLISYFRQKGRNAADIDDKRDLSYESKRVKIMLLMRIRYILNTKRD